MNNRNDELILNKLSQVETLLELASSILVELRGEMRPQIKAKKESIETKLECAELLVKDIEEPIEVIDVKINTASLCDFINNDSTYRSIESDILRIIEKEVESSSRANYFISSYVNKLADRNIQSIEQLRIFVLQHKPQMISHAKNVKSLNKGNGTVIFGVALHYLLNQI